MERDLYLDAVTFGCHPHKSGAVPVFDSAAVIFYYHKCTAFKLLAPLGNEHCIERLRYSYLISPYHYHKVCDRRAVQSQFCLGRSCEVFHRTGLDEEFRGTGEPGVVISLHCKILQHQGFQARVGRFCCSSESRCDNDGSASCAPFRIFTSQHLQCSEACIRVSVHHPYRHILCHLLIYQHFLNIA